MDGVYVFFILVEHHFFLFSISTYWKGFILWFIFYNGTPGVSGVITLFFLMATAFMGYVLPFGQMGFWGASVITILRSPFPS